MIILKIGNLSMTSGNYFRSYLRCNQMHSTGCKARKIVEPSNDDLNIWLVTYIYEHNHQQRAGPTDEPLPSGQHVQLATTRKRKEFDASNDEMTPKKQFSEQWSFCDFSSGSFRSSLTCLFYTRSTSIWIHGPLGLQHIQPNTPSQRRYISIIHILLHKDVHSLTPRAFVRQSATYSPDTT